MKNLEYKDMAVKDLTERIEAEKAELNKMKVTSAVSQIENTESIKRARRNIARMMTILHQKKNS